MGINLSLITNRKIRVYDNTSPIPFYVEFFHYGNDPITAVEPRTTTAIQLDSGRATDKLGTYVEDEAAPFAAIESTFTVAHMSEHLQLFDALGNPWKSPTWTIGGNTWVPYGPGDIGTRRNSKNEPILCPIPRDIPATAYMFMFVVGYDVPLDAFSGRPFFIQHKGVITTNVVEAFDGNIAQMTFTTQTYGTVNALLTDWPDGNECFPV